jgi:hypothetical protein
MCGKEDPKALPSHYIVLRRGGLHGVGVFPQTKIFGGQTIDYFEGYEIDHNTYWSLTLDGSRIEPTGTLRHLNHSCTPNAHFRGRWLLASRDIAQSEEITIDYLATETVISHPFTCNCGTENCRKQISTGIRFPSIEPPII